MQHQMQHQMQHHMQNDVLTSVAAESVDESESGAVISPTAVGSAQRPASGSDATELTEAAKSDGSSSA